MTPAPKRRWFRYSLRTLFVVVTVAGCLLGWRNSQIQRQRRAVAAILSMGGGVGWTGDESAGWLSEVAGRRYPIWGGFSNKNFTDDDLESTILPLTSLQDFSMIDVALTDNGLLQLSPLKSLRRLQCIRDPRNHKLVDELGGPTYLDMTDTPLTDALDYLTNLHQHPFIIDKQELSAAGVNVDVPITQNVKANTLSLGEALDATLNPLRLGYVVKEGSVIVTSAAVARRDRQRVLVEKLRVALPNLKEIKVD